MLTIVRFRRGTDMGRTDTAIVVGRRVSARRGPFLALLPGQRRQQRARKYGCVTESVSANEWKVSWDDGVVTTEKSAALRVEYTTVGREVIRCCRIKLRRQRPTDRDPRQLYPDPFHRV